MSADDYTYTPAANPANWAQVEPFVQETLDKADGRTPYSRKELAAALGPLATWCWTTGRANPQADEALDLDVIDMYLLVGLAHWTNASRNTIRSRLLRLAELLTPDQTPRPLRPLGSAHTSAPYTLKEQAGFLSWARTQGTELRRHNAARLLALGFGAGLTNEELIAAKVGDLQIDGDDVTLQVHGDRPRHVPILATWAPHLTNVSRKPDEPVFLPGRAYRSANLTGLFIMKSDNRPPLIVRRMRSTWIIGHLNRGTPVLPLLRAAGLNTIEPLDRYLRHTEPWLTHAAADALR